MRHFRRLLGLVLPIALAGQRGATSAPAVVTITYTDYAFSAPVTLSAGYTTFRAVNHGKELHHATLIKLDDGKTLADFLEAIKKPVAPGWASSVGGLQNGGRVTIELTPGHYIWWCSMPSLDGKPHSAKGMYLGFVVTATKNGAKQPIADNTVTMQDYGWGVKTPLTTGHHVLKVVNAPGQAHEFMLVALKPGKTSSDFLAWIERESGPEPFASIEGVPTMQSGFVNYVTADIKAGRYMVVSFAPDARDGKSQIVHGMVRELIVK